MSNENQSNPPLQPASNPPQQQIKSEQLPAAQTQPIKVQQTIDNTNSQPQATITQKKGLQLSESALKEPEQTTSPSRRQILSPKQMASSRRSQSPVISRGKLDAVKKMLNKQEQKYTKINEELSTLKIQRERLLEEWNSKQNSKIEEFVAGGTQRQQELTRSVNNLKEEISQIQQKIQTARRQAANLLENREIQKQGLIEKVQASLFNSQKQHQENKNKLESHLNQLRAQTTAADQRISVLSTQLTNQQTKRQDIKSKKINLQNSKRNITQDIDNLNRVQQEQKAKTQIQKLQLQKRISEARERINLKKRQLADLKSKDLPKKADTTQVSLKIEQVIAENKQLNLSIKKTQDQISKNIREAQNAKQGEKKKEKKINQLKIKIQQSIKKQNELKQQIAKLDAFLGDKNIVKYQQKVPEQLLAARSKNEGIKKEIKKVIQKCDFQKSQIDKLVPPAVIENMNKKISAIIANNDRLAQVSKIIQEVGVENEILVEERQSLQWGDNNYLKQLQAERRKQQQKNRALQEQLAQKKKNIQQLNAKLLQYVQSYPQFKPEKKKKAEPEKPKKDQKLKKGNSAIEVSEKSIPADVKKKKSTDIPNKGSTIIENVDVVIQQPKKQDKGGKKKKKNSDQQQQTKQKSPPSEIKPQKSQKKIQAKVEPKIEQKPVQKVEVKAEVKAEIKKQQKQVKVEGEAKKKAKKK